MCSDDDVDGCGDAGDDDDRTSHDGCNCDNIVLHLFRFSLAVVSTC